MRLFDGEYPEARFSSDLGRSLNPFSQCNAMEFARGVGCRSLACRDALHPQGLHHLPTRPSSHPCRTSVLARWMVAASSAGPLHLPSSSLRVAVAVASRRLRHAASAAHSGCYTLVEVHAMGWDRVWPGYTACPQPFKRRNPCRTCRQRLSIMRHGCDEGCQPTDRPPHFAHRSEEHTSELQSH